MSIHIKVVKNKKDLRKFIHFPKSLHLGHDAWTPPIYMDEWNFFNPKKNKEFAHSEIVLLLAFQDKKVVGRIMGIINLRYNEIHNESHGRFEFMECINDQDIAHALISHIEHWAREKGMSKLVGPMGFSDKDPQGFLIFGYEHRAVIDSACNHPYMVDLILNEGYQKKIDLVDYLTEIPDKVPELYNKIYSRVIKLENYQIIEFTSRKELKPFIVPVLKLMNDSYQHIYGYVPLSNEEMFALAKRYTPILDPDFLKVVTLKDEVIGFVIAIPDLSLGLKKSKGYLFPFGIFQILRSIKKSKHLVLMLGAVKEDYRGKGIDVLMAVKMFESAISRKMKTMESHLILETNINMHAEYTKVGGRIFKKFRIYYKDL